MRVEQVTYAEQERTNNTHFFVSTLIPILIKYSCLSRLLFFFFFPKFALVRDSFAS